MHSNKIYRRLRVLLLTLLLAGCHNQAHKEGQACKCVGVKDGDTIVVVLDSKQVTIRLAEVDCPEKRQAFGQRAKQFTSNLCFGKEVSIVSRGTDRYGRTIAIVYVDDDKVLNKELVKAGMAWQYKQYSHDSEYEKLEQEARAQKAGLWVDADPEAPWLFRKDRGKGREDNKIED
jgi:micrococcal nuclease